MSFQPSALEASLLDGALGGLASFVIVTVVMPRLIRYFKSIGKVGVDIQKAERPQVAEVGGVGIIVGLIGGLAITAGLILFAGIFAPTPLYVTSSSLPLPQIIYRNATLVRIGELAFVIVVVGLVGLYDDFFPLKGRQKPLLTLGLTALAFIPIAARYYMIRAASANDPERLSFLFTPYIAIPGHAPVSLTIIFPLVAIFAVTIGANATNMIDVYNGIMPATTALVGLALFVSALILQRFEAFYLLLPFLGAVFAYYRFNRYPARVFSGDVGSLSVGAGIVMIAFLSRLEIVLLIAFIPFIINGLDTLLSVGFKERRDMSARPTLFTSDGKIALNPDPRAPLPLANLFLIDGPRSEKELIHDFIYTVGLSSLLAVVTAAIMLALSIILNVQV